MRFLRLLWCVYSFWCAIIYALRLYCRCCFCCYCVYFKLKIEDRLCVCCCCCYSCRFPFAHIAKETEVSVLYPFSSHTEQYRFRTYIRCVFVYVCVCYAFVPVYIMRRLNVCMHIIKTKIDPYTTKHVFIVNCVLFFVVFPFIFLPLTCVSYLFCFYFLVGLFKIS